MSNPENKDLINQAKKLLQEMGYEVKHSHLYELFAKLANYPSWNVASAKKASLKAVIPSSSSPASSLVTSLPTFDQVWQSIKMFEGQKKFFLGALGEEMNLKNFELEPNVLYAGAMGSGKSKALQSTLLLWLLANGSHSQVYVIDPIKGAPDLAEFKTLGQVHYITKNNEQIERLINLIYEEALVRAKQMKELGVNNLNELEQKTNSKVNRILLTIEEFSSFILLMGDFASNKKQAGTLAHKFLSLMRIGRSLGIWILATSQKVTSQDIPSELIANFTNRFAFRMGNSESIYLVGMAPEKDQPLQRGTSLSENGLVSWSFIDSAVMNKYLSQVPKNQASNLLLNQDLINNILN